MRLPFPSGAPRFEPRRASPDSGLPAEVEAYALGVLDFYDLRARWDRRFFRLTSILLITIGASLPLAAGLTYDGKPIVLSLAGVTVSALTALRSFYHWDQLWVMHRHTEIVIHAAYTSWKHRDDDIVRSRYPNAANLRDEAAQRFMKELLEVRKNESQKFFAEHLKTARVVRG